LKLLLGPDALRDVAIARDAPDDRLAEALWERVALEGSPILQLDHVVGDDLGVGGELGDPSLERLRVRDRLEHGVEDRFGPARREDGLGQPPDLEELAVVRRDVGGGVDGQDAVCDRLQDRLEQRRRELVVALDALADPPLARRARLAQLLPEPRVLPPQLRLAAPRLPRMRPRVPHLGPPPRP